MVMQTSVWGSRLENLTKFGAATLAHQPRINAASTSLKSLPPEFIKAAVMIEGALSVFEELDGKVAAGAITARGAATTTALASSIGNVDERLALRQRGHCLRFAQRGLGHDAGRHKLLERVELKKQATRDTFELATLDR